MDFNKYPIQKIVYRALIRHERNWILALYKKANTIAQRNTILNAPTETKDPPPWLLHRQPPLQLNLMDYADIYRNINCLFHTLSVYQWDLSHGAPVLILLVG